MEHNSHSHNFGTLDIIISVLIEKVDIFPGNGKAVFKSFIYGLLVFLILSILRPFGMSDENPTVIWCGSLSVATMTGVSRIFAGKHYTTDVLTGAVAGSLIGYIVPHLHRKKCDVPIALFVSSRSISLSIELSKP